MDTNKLKKFAQEARTQLMAQVSAKLKLVLAEGSAARREAPSAVQELLGEIRSTSEAQVIEKVAYTWFNRFTALRFMDANGYTVPRVVTPADGQTRPELLADAAAGVFADGVSDALRGSVSALLDGRTPSRDPQGEAYRLLLVAACNEWHKHMSFLFEKISDYTELLMPDDLLSQESILSRMRAVMTDEDCRDVEIIGWLYQFYISEKKDQVFAALKKNVKITAENIPAATQLFTPHWIVRYLVENSLGRLWLLNRPASKLAAQMDYYIAPEQPETDFLKIGKPEEIKICDPACGSGHMLTYAFDLLYAIYEEEGYDTTEIPALILKHNLTGIEIDDRAGALAAFALAMMAAAKLGRRRFLRLEVKPDIVVLQDVSFTPAELRDVAAVVGKDLFTDELRETLGQLEQAKNFGSLIVPKLRDPAETLRVVEARYGDADLLLRPVLERLATVLRIAKALSPKYHVVVANPPYMGGKGMNGKLQDFARKKFPDSKADLFAMFMERSVALNIKLGMTAMINMQSWMFLSSFEKLRSAILSKSPIVSMAHLGDRAFDSIGGAVVSTTAFVLGKGHPIRKEGVFIKLVDGRSEAAKQSDFHRVIRDPASPLRYRSSTETFAKIPGEPVVYWISRPLQEVFSNFPPLSETYVARQGLATAEDDTFLRQWPEVAHAKSSLSDRSESPRWFPFTKGGEWRKWYGNNFLVVDWEDNGRRLKKFERSVIRNEDTYFSRHITWSLIGGGLPAFRSGNTSFVFGHKGPAIIETGSETLERLLCLLNSRAAAAAFEITSPGLSIEIGHIMNLPVTNGEVTSNIAAEFTRLAKSDWDAYETSWDFTSLPLLSADHRAGTLQASYARLRAHWQATVDDMLRLEEENNRIFINAYGLQNELTPDVPLDEITLTCNPAYRYGSKLSKDEQETRLLADTMAEFLHYAVGCMFGRYSLDKPGLILADQGEGLGDYLAQVTEPSFMPDEDNVIPVLDGDWFADDITERFRKFLRVTFGEEKFQENLAFIEAALGKDIRKWFTTSFFDYHVRRFKKRPIYWMFSSPKGSFNALIYMHRYRPDTVSVLLNDYLREFISKLQAERIRLEKLADDPSASQSQKTKALKDVGTVIKQIDELTEWERDVVFPLAQSKIEIDLDDGVKRNYPKFGSALKAIKGLEASDDE